MSYFDGSYAPERGAPNPAGEVIDAGRGYGVRADGSDQATSLQRALNAARDVGAELQLPYGTIITASPLLLDTGVKLRGSGEGGTIVKQADNSNLTGILKTRNYDSLVGTTTDSGETRFEISNLMIDGNKTNNASVATDGLQVFGYRYSVRDIAVRGCLGNGISAEWGGSPFTPVVGEPYTLGGQTGPMEAFWSNIRGYFNVKSGMVFNGPNDAVLRNIFMCMNAFKAQGPDPAILPNLWIKSKALACLLHSSHVWNGGNYGMQFDSSVLWVNNTAEGAQDANVYVNAPSVRMLGGRIFAAAGMIYSNKVGIKFGSTGSIFSENLSLEECLGGFFDFTTGGGSGSDIGGSIFGAAAAPLYLGTSAQANRFNLRGTIAGERVVNLLPANARRNLNADDRTDFATVSQEDDFLPGSLTSGAIGRLGWTTYFTGSSQLLNTVAPVNNHPGTIRFSTLATNPSICALGLAATTIGTQVLNNECEFVAILKPQTGTGCTVRAGWCVDPVASPSTDGVYFECLPGDTNWFGVCRAAGTQTRVDTGVAATIFTYARLRIRWYFTSALRFQFLVNSQTGANTPVEVSTNIPSLSLGVQPFIQLHSSSASDKLMDVDYFSNRIVTLTR